MLTSNEVNFNKLLLFLFLGVLVGNSFAQDEKVRGILKTRSGILIVYNEPKANFTLEVKGREFEAIESENITFLIDGKFLQVVSAFTAQFLSETQQQEKLDDLTILIAHRGWETNYLSISLNEKLKIDSEEIKLSAAKPALLWGFTVPKRLGGTVKKQLYLTVAKGKSVLVLNGAVTAETDEQTVRSLLIETAGSLRTHEKPLSQKDAIEIAVQAN